MIAVGSYMNYWWPDLPAIIPGIIVVLFLMLANLISVKAFGELEFWFSIIKVITIILMIIAGLGVILFGFGNHGQAVGISNLWKMVDSSLEASKDFSLHYRSLLLPIKESN